MSIQDSKEVISKDTSNKFKQNTTLMLEEYKCIKEDNRFLFNRLCYISFLYGAFSASGFKITESSKDSFSTLFAILFYFVISFIVILYTFLLVKELIRTIKRENYLTGKLHFETAAVNEFILISFVYFQILTLILTTASILFRSIGFITWS